MPFAQTQLPLQLWLVALTVLGPCAPRTLQACKVNGASSRPVDVLAAQLQGVSSPDTIILTLSNSPSAFGKAVQGCQAPGSPLDYGKMPIIVVQPAGRQTSCRSLASVKSSLLALVLGRQL